MLKTSTWRRSDYHKKVKTEIDPWTNKYFTHGYFTFSLNTQARRILLNAREFNCLALVHTCLPLKVNQKYSLKDKSTISLITWIELEPNLSNYAITN